MPGQVLNAQTSALTVFARLLHAYRWLSREIETRLIERHGLTVNDFETLLHLSREDEGRLRRVDLAERLRLTPSGVTRLLEGLERAGLTEKAFCPTDARVTYAVLTDAGRAVLRDAFETHTETTDELIGARLTPRELDEVASLLARLPGVGEIEGESCGAEGTAAPAA